MFLVGHGLLSNGEEVGGSALKPIFLTVVKLVFTPLVMQMCVRLFTPISSTDDPTIQFAYVYGTLPTAPSTIVIASNAGMPVQALCSAIMLSTGAWAPLSFVGAIIFSDGFNDDVVTGQVEDGLRLLSMACNVLSITSLVVLLFCVLICRSWTRIHMLVPLVLSQLAYSIGDLSCRAQLHGEPLYVFCTDARLSVVGFGCLLLAEGCGLLPGYWALVASFCLLGVLCLLEFVYFQAMEKVYEGRCWWHSWEQEQLELKYYCAIGAILLILSLYISVARRRHMTLIQSELPLARMQSAESNIGEQAATVTTADSTTASLDGRPRVPNQSPPINGLWLGSLGNEVGIVVRTCWPGVCGLSHLIGFFEKHVRPTLIEEKIERLLGEVVQEGDFGRSELGGREIC